MPLDNISELKRRVPGGKYALTRAVAERARQLQSGETPLVEVRTPNPLSVAIDEICNGKVSFEMHTEELPKAEAKPEAKAEAVVAVAPPVAIAELLPEVPALEETPAAEEAPATPEAADASGDGQL
jgi:DNA-directed RNA polymerase omega subunit